MLGVSIVSLSGSIRWQQGLAQEQWCKVKDFGTITIKRIL